MYLGDDVIYQGGGNILVANSYRKNISIFLRNDVIPRVHKEQSCNIISPLTKTLDWSVKTLSRNCNSIGFCFHLNITRVVSVT